MDGKIYNQYKSHLNNKTLNPQRKHQKSTIILILCQNLFFEARADWDPPCMLVKDEGSSDSKYSWI